AQPQPSPMKPRAERGESSLLRNQRTVALAERRKAEAVAAGSKPSATHALVAGAAIAHPGFLRVDVRLRRSEPRGEPAQHLGDLCGVLVAREVERIGPLERQQMAQHADTVVAMDAVRVDRPPG